MFNEDAHTIPMCFVCVVSPFDQIFDTSVLAALLHVFHVPYVRFCLAAVLLTGVLHSSRINVQIRDDRDAQLPQISNNDCPTVTNSCSYFLCSFNEIIVNDCQSLPWSVNVVWWSGWCFPCFLVGFIFKFKIIMHLPVKVTDAICLLQLVISSPLIHALGDLSQAPTRIRTQVPSLKGRWLTNWAIPALPCYRQ